MLEARTLELINGHVDGELNPDEQAELNTILEASAEARAAQAQLLGLSNVLDGAPERAPPPDLAARILEQLPLTDRRPAFSFAGLFSSLQPVPLGLAFAAGLLLTVGFYEMLPGYRPEMDTVGIVGTMMTNRPGQPVSQKESLVISGPGISGTVSLSGTGTLQILSFDLDSAVSAEIAIALAEAGLSFGGVAHASSSSAPADESYEVSGGTLHVITKGRQAFSVFLLDTEMNGSEKEIPIGITAGGAPVFSGLLRG